MLILPEPCPFCKNAGRAFVKYEKEVDWPHNAWYYVECRCGARGPRAKVKRTAIRYWNKSADLADSYESVLNKREG